MAGVCRRRHHRSRRVLSGARRHRPGAFAHPGQGRHPLFEGSAHRNLPQAAPGRSSDAGDGHESFPRHVLRSAQVRFQPRRPPEVQHQDGAGHAARQSHAGYAGLRFGDQVSLQAAQEHRRGGRHRPSRQPPRPRGRRTARKPVPHRPRAHGARHQGKDERVPGNVHGDAARPGQRQAGHGCDSRVLRLVAAQPVHGPDQPAQRNHPQAPSFGSWTGRSFARARGIRSPRRSPDALRPYLPD